MYANVSHHSNPTTSLCNPSHHWHTNYHLATQSPYSNIQCVQHDLSSIYNSLSSILLPYGPNRRTLWSGSNDSVKSEHKKPNQYVRPLESYICIRRVYSIVWSSCHGNQTQFDGCPRKRQHLGHPKEKETIQEWFMQCCQIGEFFRKFAIFTENFWGSSLFTGRIFGDPIKQKRTYWRLYNNYVTYINKFFFRGIRFSYEWISWVQLGN